MKLPQYPLKSLFKGRHFFNKDFKEDMSIAQNYLDMLGDVDKVMVQKLIALGISHLTSIEKEELKNYLKYNVSLKEYVASKVTKE
jgi:hypothetical protein